MAKYLDAGTDISTVRLAKFIDAVCLLGLVDSSELEKRMRSAIKGVRLLAETGDTRLALIAVNDVALILSEVALAPDFARSKDKHLEALRRALRPKEGRT